MKCPHCQHNLNDDSPKCPECNFHIDDLNEAFGEVPQLQGHILDGANLFSGEAQATLAERLQAFADSTSCQFVVVTVPTSGKRLPAEYLFWLFNRLEIGGEKNRGLMILMSSKERRIEMEVGYALEHIMTDAESQRFLEEQCVDFFRAGRFDEGICYATDLLCRVFENGLGAAQ